MTREEEKADLKRKLAASERVGEGYKARRAMIQKRLDELDMEQAR